MALVRCRLALGDRLDSSIASISLGVPQHNPMRRPGSRDQRGVIGEGWHTHSMRPGMREMKNNHSVVPVGRGDVGGEVFDAARTADRGDLRLDFRSCARAPGCRPSHVIAVVGEPRRRPAVAKLE